jgi:hypothetical protein
LTMGWAERLKRGRGEMANGRKFTATVRITINRMNEQKQVEHVRVIEASGTADAMQPACEAAFADGVEEFIAGLPATDGPLVVAPTEGH